MNTSFLLLAMNTIFLLLTALSAAAIAVMLRREQLRGSVPIPVFPVDPDLIGNGSFEFEQGALIKNHQGYAMSLPPNSQAIRDWQVVSGQPGAHDILWVEYPNPVGVPASDGKRFVDLSGSDHRTPYGGVKQTIGLLPTLYQLKLDVGGLNPPAFPGPVSVLVTIAGTGAPPQSQVFTTTVRSGWQTFTWEFEAFGVLGLPSPGAPPGIPTELRIQGESSQGNKNSIGVDRVSLRRLSPFLRK
jgi:hypothetical protein